MMIQDYYIASCARTKLTEYQLRQPNKRPFVRDECLGAFNVSLIWNCLRPLPFICGLIRVLCHVECFGLIERTLREAKSNNRSKIACVKFRFFSHLTAAFSAELSTHCIMSTAFFQTTGISSTAVVDASFSSVQVFATISRRPLRVAAKSRVGASAALSPHVEFRRKVWVTFSNSMPSALFYRSTAIE
jgi:hypothetical protein